MFPLWFFKHTKMQFLKMSTRLNGSFDRVFTLMFVNKKSLGQNIYNHVFCLAIHQLKHFSNFSHTKWWWILICFVWAWNTRFFDKDIQLWFSSYMTMGFIYGTPMLLKSNENHIVCIVTCEATIYLASIDDITIIVYFLLFQLITPSPNKNITWCGFAVIHITNLA